MIGKIIGAFVGDRIARQTNSVGGATGAALGVLAPTILRRISIPTMLMLGAGGYFAKKYFDKEAASKPATTTTPEPGAPVDPAKPSAI